VTAGAEEKATTTPVVVDVAARLNVTVVPEIETTVVPGRIPEPTINWFATMPVVGATVVMLVEPAVIFAVAVRTRTEGVTAETVVPAGIFVPLRYCPTAMLPGEVVRPEIVGLALVMVPTNVPTLF